MANSWMILWKTLIKVFLVLSLTYELANLRPPHSSTLSVSQQLFDIKKVKTSSYLSKEKISHNNLKLYSYELIMETKLYGFFIFIKGNGINSFLCIKPKNQQFHETTLHILGQLKKTNHINISLTGIDYCNSRLLNKKYIRSLF